MDCKKMQDKKILGENDWLKMERRRIIWVYNFLKKSKEKNIKINACNN